MQENKVIDIVNEAAVISAALDYEKNIVNYYSKCARGSLFIHEERQLALYVVFDPMKTIRVRKDLQRRRTWPAITSIVISAT